MSSSNPGTVTVRDGWGKEGGHHGNRLSLLLAAINQPVLMSVSMVAAWPRSGEVYCCSSFFSLLLSLSLSLSRGGKQAGEMDPAGPTYSRLILCVSHLQIQGQVTPHAIVVLPKTDGMEMLLCYEDEGVYVNTYGRITKDVVLQWGEMPTSVGT